MPAPTPIRVNYGNPILLAGLASEAGAAQARRRTAEQAYQAHLRQMAMDSTMLNADLARRFNPAQGIPQTSPSMLSDAAGYRSPIQTVTNPTGDNPIQRYAMERQAQNGGVGYMPNRPTAAPMTPGVNTGTAAASRKLVPASGPLTDPNRTPARIYEHGSQQTLTRFPEGSTVISSDGTTPQQIQDIRQMDPRFNAAPPPKMVTPEIRQQLDTVRAMEGALPDAAYKMLLKAAESGQLDMSQLVDDTRQAVPTSASSRVLPTQKQREQAMADREVARILDAGSPVDRAAFAEQKKLFEPEDIDPFIHNTDAKRAEVRARNIQRGEAAYKSWKVMREQLADARGDGTAPMTDTPQPDVSAQGMGGYTVGQSYGGMKYLGGDPNNEASWSK